MEYLPKGKQGIPHNQCTSGKNIRNPSICLEITTFLNKDTKTLSLICMLPKTAFQSYKLFSVRQYETGTIFKESH